MERTCGWSVEAGLRGPLFCFLHVGASCFSIFLPPFRWVDSICMALFLSFVFCCRDLPLFSFCSALCCLVFCSFRVSPKVGKHQVILQLGCSSVLCLSTIGLLPFHISFTISVFYCHLVASWAFYEDWIESLHKLWKN